MLKIWFSCIILIILTACSPPPEETHEYKITLEDHRVAVTILANRKQYANDIRIATNECLANSKNVLALTKADNDSEDIVELCIHYAYKLYVADSDWSDSWLIKAVNAYPKQGQISE